MEIIKLNTSEITSPSWHTNEDEASKMINLKRSIVTIGQVKPILVQKKLDGGYQLIEGRKILKCMLELGKTEVYAVLVDGNERLINAMVNKITFDTDNIAFSEMVNELQKEFPVYSLCNYLPFTAEELKNFHKLHNFDWSEYDKEVKVNQTAMFGDEEVEMPELTVDTPVQPTEPEA